MYQCSVHLQHLLAWRPSVCRYLLLVSLILPKRYIPVWLNTPATEQHLVITIFQLSFSLSHTHCSSLFCQLVSLSRSACLSVFFSLSCQLLLSTTPLCSHFVPYWMLIKSLPWTHAWPALLPVKLEVILPLRCRCSSLPLGGDSMPQSVIAYPNV